MPAKKKMSEKVDKRYRGKIKIGSNADGKPIYKYVTAKTKRELGEKLDEAKRTYIADGTKVRRDTLFAEAATAWYNSKKIVIKDNSAVRYKTTINKHLLPQLADYQLRAITRSKLQGILDELHGAGRTTLVYVRATLRGIFSQAFADGVIDRDPSTGLKIYPGATKERRALTEAEAVAALRIGQTDPDGLALLILYYTGIRVGELFGLQWKDVDFKAGVLHIRRDVDYVTRGVDTLKTDAAKRDIPLFEPLVKAMSRARGIGTAFIIQSESGDYTCYDNFAPRWARLMNKIYNLDKTIESREVPERLANAAMGDNPRMSILTPHYFRHNFASLLHEAGVDVLDAKKWMGHKNASTTLNIYTHLPKKTELGDAAKLNKALLKFLKVAEKLPK